MSRLSSQAISPAALLSSAIRTAALDDELVQGLPLLADAARRIHSEFVDNLPSSLFGANADELRDAAHGTAEQYSMLLRDVGDTALDSASERLGRPVPGSSKASQVARILDPSFWLKHYRRLARQRSEFAYVKSGFVSKSRELYVSDATLAQYEKYLEAQEQWLQSTYLIDSHAAGKRFKSIKLADAMKKAEHRDANMYAFLAGVEQLSVEAGLDCAMVTLTAPSQYHANPAIGAKGRFDGVSTPRGSHDYIAGRWNAFQRDLDNHGEAVSGLRFTEPQGDGTTHWHVWLHYRPELLSLITSLLSKHFPGDSTRRVHPLAVRRFVPDLRGTHSNKRTGARFTEKFYVPKASAPGGLVATGPSVRAQVDFGIINRAYANGATYASKYCTKSFSDNPNAKRVRAWRWVWQIRSFQAFGLRSCRGLWDEFFRVSERPNDDKAGALWDAVHSAPGLHTREAVNWLTGDRETFTYEGGTAAFLRLQGGLAAAGKASDDLRVRRTYRDAQSRYGDVLKRPLGVVVLDGDLELFMQVTREPGRWLIVAGARVDETLRALRDKPLPQSPLAIRQLTGDEFKVFMHCLASGIDLETGEIRTLP